MAIHGEVVRRPLISVLVVVIGLLSAACSSGGAVEAKPPPTATRRPTTIATPVELCHVSVPDTIAHSLHLQWAKFHGVRVVPFVQNQGKRPWFMAQVATNSFKGVALVNADSADVRTVDRFSKADTYQAGGTYDGKAAVWKEYHSLDTLDEFAVKIWSAATGRVETVAHSRNDLKTGQPFPSPWEDPVMVGEYAAWVEGTGIDGRGQVVVLNMRTRQKRIFSSGHPGGNLMIYQGHLIWTESLARGALTTALAKDLETAKPVPVPPALRAEKGGYSLATDGHAIAWVSADGRRLMYSSDGLARAHMIYKVSHGGFNPPMVVRGSVVMTGAGSGILASSAGGVSMHIVPEGGGLSAFRDGFLVGEPNLDKRNETDIGVAQVDAASLRLDSCR